MKHLRHSAFAAALVLAASAPFLLAQEEHRRAAHAGPYRVLISKPIVAPGYKAGSLYREHEYLGAMFNQLAADGLEPIMTTMLTQTLEGHPLEQRMLVVCRAK